MIPIAVTWAVSRLKMSGNHVAVTASAIIRTRVGITMPARTSLIYVNLCPVLDENDGHDDLR